MIKIEEYFRESNLIEGVTSGRALKQSLDAWNYLSSLEWLNTNRIETAHGFLMEGFMTYGAGLIRTADVVVGGRLCPQAHKVLALLMVWCDEWAQDRLPKDQADMKMAHIKFEHIHPFFDGNGRMGRMLMLWHANRAGLEPIFIKNDEKETYYDWF